MTPFLVALALFLSSTQPQGAVIRGRVLAGDTGAPIKAAVVTINGTSRGVQRSINTDENGVFEFGGLPPDSYQLGAGPGLTRAQYLALRYRGRSPTDPGMRIDVGEGQVFDRADIVLPRAAVIGGRVTNEAGEPLARVPVTLIAVRDGRTQRTNDNDTTDDRGEFRIFGLSAGEYVVAAELRPAAPPRQGEAQGTITSYYPGTASLADAARIRLAPGEEAAADIRFVRSRLYRISGSVVNSRGEPLTSGTVLAVRPATSPQARSTSATLDGAGRFTIRDLAPADYRLIVRDRSQSAEATGIREYAAADVRLEADVNDVVLMTGPGTNLEGRLVFEPAQPAGARVFVSARPPDRFGAMAGAATGAVTDPDTFVLADLFGPLLIRGELTTPTGWTMKAVRLRGRDITDTPTEFTAADSGALELVFTSGGATLEGRVVNTAGASAAGRINVLIFGEDPATWFGAASMVRLVGPDKDGRFSATGLRPGRYLVGTVSLNQAVDVLSGGRDVFEPLAADATRVELGEGERRSITLRLQEAR